MSRKFMIAFMASILVLLIPSASSSEGHGDTAEPGVVGPDMFQNDTWSYTFTEAAEFDYHCHPHPWMQSKVTVLASIGGEPVNHTIVVVEPENFENWTFNPTEITIYAGDTVTWVNTGAQMHKVSETTAEHADHIAGAGYGKSTSPSSHEEHSGGATSAFLWVLVGIGGGLFIARFLGKKRA